MMRRNDYFLALIMLGLIVLVVIFAVLAGGRS
jgi:hypothetical protein